jgi:hypothetical protein
MEGVTRFAVAIHGMKAETEFLRKRKKAAAAAFDFGGEIFLPLAPGAAHVVAQAHGDEDEEGEEAGAAGELDEAGAVLYVHEEEDDDAPLEAGDGDGDDGVEDAELEEGDAGGGGGQEQQRDVDERILRGADDVVAFVCGVGDEVGMMFCHLLSPKTFLANYMLQKANNDAGSN